MKLDEKSRVMKRMMEGALAQTTEEIVDRQRKGAAGMMNTGMRPVPGMQNMWATNVDDWIPEPQKPTFWQRVKRLLG